MMFSEFRANREGVRHWLERFTAHTYIIHRSFGINFVLNCFSLEFGGFWRSEFQFGCAVHRLSIYGWIGVIIQ